MHTEHYHGPARCDELDRPGQAVGSPARLDRDVLAALAAGAGNREQTERAGADDRDPLAWRGVGEAQGVPRDGSRLDDRRVAQIETIGDRDESRGRGAERL